MNKNILSIIYVTTAIFTALISSGCSSHRKEPQAKENIAERNAAIERSLVSSAKSIEHSLQTLAMVQAKANPPLLNTGPLITAEGGMGGTADIDWTGPIAPLLKKISSMADYELKILGKPPAIPIIVSITQQKTVIADILKNASLQAGKHAEVMVFPASRTIELRYLPS